ncbi:MAG: metallophosphatase family protein [Bacteroidaceae bacterium]|nr:metallophosphatase family protein [Bacteroidaceae bacterium]
MTKIGLLSDTHAWWDDRYAHYFSECDEVWHAGDIGSAEVADRFEQLPVTFRAVHGNIDGYDIRLRYPEMLRFTVDGVDVLLKHIGGYPGKYDPSVRAILMERPPRLFVCGHSHILKVKYDRTLDMLHINPGAAGVYGIQAVRTLVRFTLAEGAVSDLEVIELR